MILLLIPAQAFSQNTAREELTPHLAELREEIKIYTDRMLYISGEPVWFNAEYTINKKKTRSLISKVMYIELVNEKGNAIVQKKFAIDNHSAEGMFEIPDGAPTGNYVLRAYTQYQRNFSPYHFTYAHLLVFNPELSPEGNQGQEKVSVDIFAEGDVVLMNKPARFALKTSHPEKTDSLVLIDNSGTHLREIKLWSNGLALIELLQNDSLRYGVTAYLNNGDSVSATFPTPHKHYPALTTSVTDGVLHYEVIQEKDKNTSPLLQVYTPSLHLQYQKKLTGHKVKGNIPEKFLNAGIYFVVVREESSGEILALRTIYSMKEKTTTPAIKLNTSSFNTREKVEVAIEVTPADASTDKADLSVSVARSGTGYPDNALSRFVAMNPWLIDDFLAHQKHPRIFSEQVETAMIVFEHRYAGIFKKRLNNKAITFEHLPELRDVTISGLVRDKNTGDPVPHEQVYGSVLFNNPQFHIYRTNDKGEFIFSLNGLQDMQDVFLCPVQHSEQASDYEIKITRDFDPRHPEFVHTPFSLDENDKAFLEELILNFRLNMSFNKTAKEKEEQAKQNHYHLFGKERITRNLDEYIELDDMWDVLYEVVPHVKPFKRQGAYHIKIMDDNSRPLPGSPLILVDNVPIFDNEKIMEMHPSQVDKIEVIDRTYLLGSHAINGVVLITTKTKNFGGIEFPEASVFSDYQTITEESRFYETTYGTQKDANIERVPDFRNILYWNPGLSPREINQGFSFFTSDRKGHYDIIIKGTDNTGAPVYTRKTILVQ